MLSAHWVDPLDIGLDNRKPVYPQASPCSSEQQPQTGDFEFMEIIDSLTFEGSV